MRLERAIEKVFNGFFKTMLLAMIEEPVAYYASEVPTGEQCTAVFFFSASRSTRGPDFTAVLGVGACTFIAVVGVG